MGQYFVAANKTKQEFVCPWCVGGVAKLWEWAANPWGALFTILLRRSTGGGGGDYNAGPPVMIDMNANSQGEIAETLARGVLREGQPSGIPPDSVVGRWAGDEIFLVGDYDESKLYQEAFDSYRNISKEVVDAWNEFMDVENMQLKYNSDCSCTKNPVA